MAYTAAISPEVLAAHTRLANSGEAMDLIEEILATPGIIGVDFETTIDRCHGREVCVFQAAHQDGREALVHIWREPILQERLRKALDESPAELAAHFAIFEMECFRKLGARPRTVHCTYVAARVLHGAMIGGDSEDEEEFGGWSLKDLALSFYGVQLDKNPQKQDWTRPLDETGTRYALIDARMSCNLWEDFREEFDADPDSLRGYETIRRALPAIACCNVHGGLQFDHDAHAALCVQLEREMLLKQMEMDLLCGGKIDNHNSTKQVSAWVANHLFGQPMTQLRASLLFHQATEDRWPMTATHQLSLNRKLLEGILETLEFAFPYVAEYLKARMDYQKAAKVIQAFGPGLAEMVDADGCIRGSLIPHGARTSRQSCRSPNLQQMPNDDPRAGVFFRSCFVARPGRKLIICDYGQIELRVGSIITGDTVMQELFASGADIHAATAVKLYGLGEYDDDNPLHRKKRKTAKAPNFAALYGAEAPAIATGAGVKVAEARELLDGWLDIFKGVARYRREQPELAREAGYVQLVSGQKIAVVENTRPAQMINAPVQGGSASVLYRAVELIYERLMNEPIPIDAVLTLLVHDEIIIDAAEEDAVRAAEIMQECMVQALLEFFPQARELGIDNVADASVCDTWSQKDDKACSLENYRRAA